LATNYKLCFASNNQNKLKEIYRLVSRSISVVGLKEIGFDGDIAETGNTLEENAEIKAKTISNQYGIDCFADDTGLEVAALDGAPGIFSARYAGEPHDDSKNLQLLLKNMLDQPNKSARFVTVIALFFKGQIHFFKGVVEGHITMQPAGESGFGYDPVFIPKGFHRTFAEMSLEEKNSISHRGKAMNKLANFLNNLLS